MAEKEETRRLVGVGPAAPRSYNPFTRAKQAKAKAKEKAMRERWLKLAERYGVMKTDCSAGTGSSEEGPRHLVAERFGVMKTDCSAGTGSSEEGPRHLVESKAVLGYPVPFVLDEKTAPRRGCSWLQLLPFPRPDPEPIRSFKALRARHEESFRRKMPRSELRARNRNTALRCLQWYNSKHPDDEYEPAPGVLTRHTEYNKSVIWTHGNFVARRKHPGCLSFLPAPRTLFFFELLDRHGDGFGEVITCTPIDEPVTEAYTFLGFPLGRGTRRRGGADCVCKTCYRQFHVPHIGLKRTCACGDSKVESVCKMCYLYSDVLHPTRGGFAFGQESFVKIFR